MARCNHDCFNCKFDDCVNDTITISERAESRQRDINYMSYGNVIKQRPQKAKHRGRRT